MFYFIKKSSEFLISQLIWLENILVIVSVFNALFPCCLFPLCPQSTRNLMLADKNDNDDDSYIFCIDVKVIIVVTLYSPHYTNHISLSSWSSYKKQCFSLLNVITIRLSSSMVFLRETTTNNDQFTLDNYYFFTKLAAPKKNISSLNHF